MSGLVFTQQPQPVLPAVNVPEHGFPWLKHAFYFLVSLLLTAGIFFLEQEAALSGSDGTLTSAQPYLTVEGNNRIDLLRDGADVPEKFSSKIDIHKGDSISTHASSNVTLHFTTDALMRLDENTEILISDVNLENHTFLIQLLSGQMWLNNLYNTAHVSVQSGGAVIEPQEALLNIYRVDQKVEVQVYRHQVKVSFYDADGNFLNDLFISEGNKINIPLYKLGEILSKLYYSKLVKEFQYSLFDQDAIENDPWAKENLAKDGKQDTEVRERERQSIKDQGLKNAAIDTLSFQLNQFLNQKIKFPLTLVDNKKKDFYVQDLFTHIDDAIYLAEEGRLDESGKRLEFFDLLKNDPFYFQKISDDDFKTALEKRIHRLIFVVPNEDLYSVKQYLLNQRLSLAGLDAGSYFEFLSYYLDDVYDAAGLNYAKATVVLENYFKMESLVLSHFEGDTQDYTKSLQVQNHFLDNLFLRYPVFYKKEILQSKARMEKSFLAVLPAGDLKNEENQALISKKIELLKRLQYFFFNDQVQLETARSVVGTLITNIEDLLPPDSSKIAIQEFFKKSLGDFNLFWGFLNNNEYAATNTYGTTNQTRYDKYIESQDENAALLDLASSFFTDQNSEVIAVPKEELIRQVKKDLAGAGFKNIAFADDIQDGDQLIKIKSATLNAFNISGVYDREKGLMSDIYVGGNLLSKSAVKLKNIEVLLNNKFGSLKENLSTDSTINSENQNVVKVNKKQKLLITLFVNKLQNIGIEIEDSDVEVLNEDNGDFHVVGLAMSDAAEALYSFDVLGGGDVASNIYIITLRHQIKLKEDVDLKDLSSSVKSAYQEYLKEIDADATDTSQSPVKVPKKPLANSST